MAYVLASALAFRVLMDILFKLSVKNVAFNSIGDFFTSFWKVISSVSFLVAIIVSGINFFFVDDGFIPLRFKFCLSNVRHLLCFNYGGWKAFFW